MSPKISVLIPAYNREKYIEECVQSVLNQTFSDFEVIIINDASTDKTAEISKKICEKDPRVKLINHKENKLRSGALNTGIENSKGEYICFLDSDDIYLPSKLESQINFLEKNKEVDGVYGDYIYFKEGEEGERVITAILDVGYVKDHLVRIHNGEDIPPMIKGWIPSCSALIRSYVFDKISFDEKLTNMEDFDMWLQILGAGFQMVRIPELTYKYRGHDNQKSGNSEKMIFARSVINQKAKDGIYLRDLE